MIKLIILAIFATPMAFGTEATIAASQSQSSYSVEHQKLLEHVAKVHTKTSALEDELKESKNRSHYSEYEMRSSISKINEAITQINARLNALESILKRKDNIEATKNWHGNIKKYSDMLQKKKYKEASEGLLAYINENQNITDMDEAYYLLGMAYLNMNKYEDSSSCFLKSYKNYPKKTTRIKISFRTWHLFDEA